MHDEALASSTPPPHREAFATMGSVQTLTATRGAQQNGYASYYSDALAGRATATGEPYDPGAFTAAHPHSQCEMKIKVGVMMRRGRARIPWYKG